VTSAATLAATSGGGLPITWILLAILAIFWIFLLMQNRKRRAAQLEQRASIDTGSKVLLTSGFIGTLVSKDGDQAEIELAPGFTVRVLVTAIARTLPEADTTDVAEIDDAPAADHALLSDDGVTDTSTPNRVPPPSTGTTDNGSGSAITEKGNNRRD
jgi:preprotein translocase YajC subunit